MGCRAVAWPFRAWAALADMRRGGELACEQRPAAEEPNEAVSLAPLQRLAEAGSGGARQRRLAAAFWHWQVWLAAKSTAACDSTCTAWCLRMLRKPWSSRQEKMHVLCILKGDAPVTFLLRLHKWNCRHSAAHFAGKGASMHRAN